MSSRSPSWRATVRVALAVLIIAGELSLAGCGGSRPKIVVPEKPAPRPDPAARLRRPVNSEKTPVQERQ